MTIYAYNIGMDNKENFKKLKLKLSVATPDEVDELLNQTFKLFMIK